MKYVIIGNSAAGMAGAFAIRKYDREGEITVISNDGIYPYSRYLASYLLAGSIKEQEMEFCSRDIYRKLKLELVFNQVVRADFKNKELKLKTNESISFDRLLIASGAHPVVPDLPGISGVGVYPLRTLQHAKNMLALLPVVKQVVVLGGGLVSLKGAAALAKRGKDVTVAASSNHLMSQVIDEQASGFCQRDLEKLGIKLIFKDDAVGIERDREGHVQSVMLASGRHLPCQLVLYSKGVSPNTDFLPHYYELDLEQGKGLKVNSYLETKVPGVFAAGDVIESYDIAWQNKRLNSLWPIAREQGAIAGANMAGQEVIYQGSLSMNAVDFADFRIIAAGVTRNVPADCSVHVKRLNNGQYEKLVFRGEQLVGYILVGKSNESKNLAQAGYFTQLIKSGQLIKDMLLADNN